MALASLVPFASGLLGPFDAGGKRVALSMSSAMGIPTIPAELFTKFETSFYADLVVAVVKVVVGWIEPCRL